MVETGHFATLWRQMAARWGIEVDFLPGDWRHGADPAAIEAKLAQDTGHAIKAVMVVHNETSTGVTSRVGDIRAAIDRAGHPALLLVDTISSLGSVDFRHDEWKVDVTVACSQKGFMLPPGLGFNAISEKARAAAKTNKMPRSYWDWEEMLKPNAAGFFPYTPATNLLYGLREAIAMLLEEGLDNVFARHKRLAAATRAAVAHWGLEVLCLDPAEYSPVLTAVLMPPGHDADAFRKVVLDNYNMSLGSGLSKVAGKVFRIGHLGECNELTLMGALSGVEMGLAAAGVPHRAGGVDAAMASLDERTGVNSPAHLKVVKT
jgi:alanine-glyoxylate transaminase/serine-glyoxylate transaminase/serine-pyruvate transaminase